MIEWNPFVRGRIHKSLTTTMTKYYRKECNTTHQFTGIEWSKEVIEFMLKTYIAEWYHLCKLNSQPSGTNYLK